MKIFVIAGNRQQADQWIKTNLEKRSKSGSTTLSWSDYVVVSDVNKLRGIQDPHGVFIGTWRERLDTYEIVQTLIYNSVHVNKQLHDIHNSLKPKVRPTPKYLNGVWSDDMGTAVKRASEALAMEIDAEVLRNLTRKINGGVL